MGLRPFDLKKRLKKISSHRGHARAIKSDDQYLRLNTWIHDASSADFPLKVYEYWISLSSAVWLSVSISLMSCVIAVLKVYYRSKQGYMTFLMIGGDMWACIIWPQLLFLSLKYIPQPCTTRWILSFFENRKYPDFINTCFFSGPSWILACCNPRNHTIMLLAVCIYLMQRPGDTHF
jgi:hypothetical protein